MERRLYRTSSGNFKMSSPKLSFVEAEIKFALEEHVVENDITPLNVAGLRGRLEAVNMDFFLDDNCLKSYLMKKDRLFIVRGWKVWLKDDFEILQRQKRKKKLTAEVIKLLNNSFHTKENSKIVVWHNRRHLFFKINWLHRSLKWRYVELGFNKTEADTAIKENSEFHVINGAICLFSMLKVRPSADGFLKTLRNYVTVASTKNYLNVSIVYYKCMSVIERDMIKSPFGLVKYLKFFPDDGLEISKNEQGYFRYSD